MPAMPTNELKVAEVFAALFIFALIVDYKEKKIILQPEAALFKIKHWCAYQERSQHETRKKLYEYGLHEEEVENILADLISENFLNEERFAKALTSGKFRIKHWGKIKIKLELKKRRVPERLIDEALQAIDDDEYKTVLQKVIEKKRKLLKGNDKNKNFYLLLNYAISKGFERDLVVEQLNEVF